jgi:hypothetical protein
MSEAAPSPGTWFDIFITNFTTSATSVQFSYLLYFSPPQSQTLISSNIYSVSYYSLAFITDSSACLRPQSLVLRC